MLLLILLIPFVDCTCLHKKEKNVVIIMADDLGYNDVSYRGSTEIPTYNIDSLAYNGIILNNFRTPPLCTPSRSALMTGKYPQHLGMHEFVIFNDEPWGLSPSEKIMPQYFKDAGYATKLIGKWHLGFFQDQYVPNNRGFDSFFGYLAGAIDYWDYTWFVSGTNYSRGYDMRRNLDVANNIGSKYATELFTEEAVHVIKTHDKTQPLFLMVSHLAPHAGNEDVPMQAKQEDIDRFSHITDIKRRTLAAMIYQLDKSVGKIVKALSDSKLLDNSIIIFLSDNGGPTFGLHSTAASNYPLRGQKRSGWEGAIRCNAIVYSPSLPKSIVRNGMFYVGDLLPTLKTISNADFEITTQIDGIDQTSLLKNDEGKRKELVTIDGFFGYSSFIQNDYKLLNGTIANGIYDAWLGTNENVNALGRNTYMMKLLKSDVSRAFKSSLTWKNINNLRKSAAVSCRYNGYPDTCDLRKGPCLFNLADDPCEQRNLADTHEAILQTMISELERRLVTKVASRRRPGDPLSDPKYHDLAWSPWQENFPVPPEFNPASSIWPVIDLPNQGSFSYQRA